MGALDGACCFGCLQGVQIGSFKGDIDVGVDVEIATLAV